MIKAVLFDYGGVLADGGRPGQLSNNLAVNLQIPNEHAEALVAEGFERIKRGRISEDEFWHILEKSYGYPIDLQHRNIWANWEELRPLQEMHELRDDLISEGLVVGILSNTEPNVAKLLRDHGAYDNYSPVILSCEVTYAKPDQEIYELAIEKLNLDPIEILFIDDQLRMIEPAKKLGMQVVHAKSTEQTIRDIRKLIEY